MRWAMGSVLWVILAISGLAGEGRLPVIFQLGETQPGPGLTATVVGDGPNKVYLREQVELTSDAIASATVVERDGRVAIAVKLTPEGAKTFLALTKANVGKVLVIVVAGKVIMAPVIRSEIAGGQIPIEGSFSRDEATRLANGIMGK